MNDKTPAQAEIADRDNMLCFLADMVNTTGINLDVTLSCNGMFVSGTMITNVEFWETTAVQCRSAQGNHLSEMVAHLFDEAAKGARDANEARQDQESGTQVRVIHLKNAQFFSDGQAPLPRDPVTWRGLISRVSGFTFGKMALWTTDHRLGRGKLRPRKGEA